jgi:hypothetical protein
MSADGGHFLLTPHIANNLASATRPRWRAMKLCSTCMVQKLANILVAVLFVSGILCIFVRALVGPREWGGVLDGALILPIAIGLSIEAFIGREFTWARTHRPMPTWLGRILCMVCGGFSLFAAWRIWHQ